MGKIFYKHYPYTHIKRRKTNWIGHILCRNCLLKHVIEWKIERRTDVKGRWGRRCKHIPDDLKETIRYRKPEVEALDHVLWKTRSGRGCRSVVRQTVEWWLWWGGRIFSNLSTDPLRGISLTTHPHLYFHGMDGDNFSLTFTVLAGVVSVGF